MQKFVHVEIYLPVKTKKLEKLFHQVSDPTHRRYGKYQKVTVGETGDLLDVLNLPAHFPEAEIRSTYFPDVLSAKLPKEALFFCKKQGIAYQENEQKAFREVTAAFESLKIRSQVGLLPYIPHMSRKLKERVHIECMKFGIEGTTLLAPSDTAWAEFPSVLVVAPPTESQFSAHFKRKTHAPYQQYHVSTYLRDPQVAEITKSRALPMLGRASPDIYEEKLDRLMQFLRRMNRKLAKEGRPLLGFVNPFFYQTAHGFSRNEIENQSALPDSTTFWRAHVGLGKPNYKKLEEELRELPGYRSLFTKLFSRH